ncbi:hypothetical protein [Amycolatopsis benzoatilytica]|uniref:hypothetical protein n=1 Tax=Amycolatopsis benzoatilytica TaxID=346045 RepID=UPI00037D9900|nr:hypothetical protein [Amycolatopsis benzoatilytica]
MKQDPECRSTNTIEALSSADHSSAIPDLPGTRSARRLGRAFATAGLIMIPWILYLSMSLPKQAMDSHWALAWVGLDSCEALTLFATGRFLKQADNRCTLTATAAAALLLTDAWFDVTAATSGGELAIAIVMAVCVEIPIAIVCTVLASRLIRHPFPQRETTEQAAL